VEFNGCVTAVRSRYVTADMAGRLLQACFHKLKCIKTIAIELNNQITY